LVDEGEKVSKGQPLFRLETASLSEDAQAAKANVEAAQVGVDQLKPLVKQNIISNIQLETAKAKLAQAQANYKSITANIGYANIASPIDGFVGSIPYRKGSLVSPTSPLPLTTVSNTNEVYLYFSMNEADYLDFLQTTPGKTLAEKMKHFPSVQLQLANGTMYGHEGKIQTVTAQVDPSTGTVSFRAIFPNPEHLIANGSSGTIFIPKIYKNAILVPEEATYEQQGKTYVYQVLKDNTVTPKIITVAGKVNNILIASNGIQAGDKIVAQGTGKLKDKDNIIPVPTSFDSVANNLKPVFQ
jgi:membrane fusion protein (multidrug efflux system)